MQHRQSTCFAPSLRSTRYLQEEAPASPGGGGAQIIATKMFRTVKVLRICETLDELELQ